MIFDAAWLYVTDGLGCAEGAFGGGYLISHKTRLPCFQAAGQTDEHSDTPHPMLIAQSTDHGTPA